MNVAHVAHAVDVVLRLVVSLGLLTRSRYGRTVNRLPSSQGSNCIYSIGVDVFTGEIEA